MKLFLAIVGTAVALSLIATAAGLAADRRADRARLRDQCIVRGYTDFIEWRDVKFCIGYDLVGQIRLLNTEALE